MLLEEEEGEEEDKPSDDDNNNRNNMCICGCSWRGRDGRIHGIRTRCTGIFQQDRAWQVRVSLLYVFMSTRRPSDQPYLVQNLFSFV